MKLLYLVESGKSKFLVFDEMPDKISTKYGDDTIIGRIGGIFYDFLAKRNERREAFGGRKFDIVLDNGEIEKCEGQWWDAFKKGDILISTLGNPFIYNGIINREGDMGCIYGISAYGEIISEEVPIWTSVCSEDKSKYVRLATEEEKKSFAERIANTENLKKAGIIKQYLSKYEYLLDGQKKYDFKPFDQVLVRASNLGNWNLHLFARVREEEYKYECLGGLRYKECIPYQGNEHLLGTNKSK